VKQYQLPIHQEAIPRRHEAISQGSLPGLILAASPGSILTLGGLDSGLLRRLMDQIEPPPKSPRVLLLRLLPAPTVGAVVQQLIGQLAETTHRLWPIWFTDIDFAGLRNDTLGRLAGSAMIRRATGKIDGLSSAWAEAAIELGFDRCLPRVQGTPPASEVAQLALAVSRYGLVLVVDIEAHVQSTVAVVVNALEWIAHHTHCAVIAVFPELPSYQPPFDRILYGARVFELDDQEVDLETQRPVHPVEEVWLAPWLGSPHPLSETEQRLEKALRADTELAPLFGCNQFVETVRGSRPKIDFVWVKGRLAVELDGYGSHGNRMAFMYDRHRDYELTLSGYTVLRLANDEIAQDIGKAVEKIRDLVHLCRDRIT
jgi:very-short-patch-repair endonuclease